MMKVGEEVWITAAVDDATATKALVLGRSLRRSVTSRRIAVVVSNPVSENYRKLLADEFDEVLRLDKLSYFANEMNGLPLVLHSKLFCWGLPFLKRVVFLNPDDLVVRNADELFDIAGENIAFDGFAGVQIIKPDLQLFEEILDAVRQQKIHSGELLRAEKELAVWLHKQGRLVVIKDQKYSVPIGSLNSAFNEENVSICRFLNGHPFTQNVPGKLGILESAVCSLWREIFVEDVNPKITGNPVKVPFSTNIQEDISGPEEPVAIIGMSCRFPGANSVEEYWEVLLEERDCIQKVPEHRWPSGRSQEYREVQAGFLKCPVDTFDGKFFGISPADLINTDPQQRLLMEVVWEALEDAVIDPQSLKGTTTGVFVGSWTSDYRDLINDQGMDKLDAELTEFHRLYMGNSLGGTGGRLAYLLGLTGPNVATESGCSSGMVAIYLATESLRQGRCKVAIAGGVNLLLHPFKRKHMQSIIAPDGRCKTFDERADGFGRGEGVASLILKKYSDAVRDGDRVYALIRGTGIAQEGTSRSFGTPTKECQELAMTTALRNAGLKPNEVCYVEAHGTGTMVGDPVEMAAITKVYSKDRTEPLIVASGKTNIGHTESCSGFAGIIKVILSMQHNLIPKHLHLEKVNPHIDFDAVPAVVPLQAIPWKRSPGSIPRFAGISSFGITGTDAHIIIQEAPQLQKTKVKIGFERPLNILTFSSKSELGLDSVLTKYSEYLEKNPELDIGDVANTANSGRAHFSYRVAIIAKDLPEAVKKMKNSVGGSKKHIPEKPPKLCFLFTGQGSQYEGMAKSLYETSPIFRMHLDKCLNFMQERFNIDLNSIIWPKSGGGSEGKLKRSLYSQTAIFCVEYALTELWISWGLKPDMVLGHSLGEFAAAVCAGMLTLEDALTLVAERSRLIEAQKQGGMLVIKADKQKVDKLLSEFNQGWLDLAAVNSADQTVLAGEPQTISDFSAFLTAKKNVKNTILESSSAFHSRHMDPILPEYSKILEKVKFQEAKPGIQYISGLTGKPLGSMNSSYWVKHTREAVKFQEASTTAWNEDARVFLEIGPQPVLSALTMQNVNDLGDQELIFVPSLRKKEEDWVTILNTLGKLYTSGFTFNWSSFEQFYDRKKISLPFYPFHRKSFWYNQGKNGGEEGSQGALTFNSANLLHPLIGHNFPNATTMKIYQSSVNGERFPYLKDHCIGGKVIFPGAGYLEMCLAAGNASTSIQLDNEKVTMSGNPVAIDNLKIEAPLCVDEVVHMQTTADCTQEETLVSVFTLRQKKWVRQATATFTPLPMTFAPDESQVSKEPFSTILSRLSPADVNISEFYDKLAEVGLSFGPIFRSIKQIWKGTERELVCEVDIPEGSEDYLVHPVVLDSLIQSIMVGMNRKVDSLFVPISIQRVVLFSQKSPEAQKYYCHCHWSNEGADSRSAVLYDDTGKLLAFMSGVQMIETSVLQILKALDHQKLSLPGMYEEAWKPKSGIWKNRTNMKLLARDYLFSKEFNEKIGIYNNISDSKKKCKRLREELVFMYGLKAFYDMGWSSPQVGGSIDITEFIGKYGILKSHDKLLTRLLNIILEEGLLERISKTLWKVAKKFPDETTVHKKLRDLHIEFCQEGREGVPPPPDATPSVPDDIRVMQACGEALSKILQGKASALPILFPEDRGSDVSADSFYNNTPLLWAGGRNLMKMIMTETFSHWPDLSEEDRGVVRILEVGAGTGSSTKIFLECLEEFGIKYQYTFSDISPAFFLRARPQFEGLGKKINYKVLNIEEDPQGQGFAPATYDIVFGSNVIHATKDLEETMINIRQLLRDSGLFMMIETFEPNRDIDLVFGVLEGFWRYSDLQLRPEHPFVDADKWCEVISRAGHSKVQKFYCYDNMNGGVMGKASDILPLYKPPQKTGNENVWLVFSNPETFNSNLLPMFTQSSRKTLLIQPGNNFKIAEGQITIRSDLKEDMDSIFKHLKDNDLSLEGILYMWGLEDEDPLKMTHPFLFLAQSLISDYKGLPRMIVVTQGVIPVGDQSATSVSPGTLWGMARSFRSEHSNMFVRCIDLDPDEENKNLKFKELWAEMWFDDNDYQVAYRQRSRHVCRFVTNKDTLQPLNLPNSERFSLVLPKTRNINDLTFCANGKPALKEGQVEIQVKCIGLNFRDVFVVLKPDIAFEKYNTVGLEFAGVVNSLGPKVTSLKVGDPVIGCNFTGDALPSHAICDTDVVIPMPKGMSYHEACTLPAAFGTAYYCLVKVADLQRGETVLIHAGSGGVGLYAIQVALALGAEVITTAGSRRKRAYLRGLGCKHVFHSRNTDYGHQIKEISKGVDVVLNCLTSPGFKEASLDVCRSGARFVEISKMAIWSEEDVAALRKDVKYWVIDLTTVTYSTWGMLWSSLKEFYEKGYLKPIPYVRFDAQHIREALLYMQKAKHIGKVLITMPEPGGQSDPKTFMFNSMSTYLITGGLGGIGLEVAKWMTESGAQHVVLVSRREPNDRAAKMIAEMTGKGKHIVVKQLDVGDYQECHELIEGIQKGKDGLPPLRGVMHAAGSLSDATYTNQTIDTFKVAFRGKVEGAWNLHLLTTQLECRLEHFVLYSSIVAIFGPIGLSNYAAANTFLDALAHHRNSVGLTAQTINWGQWAEVGAAANIHITAIRAFTPSQGIAGLEAAMKSLKPQSCILEVDFSALRKFTGHAAAYLEEMKISKDSHSTAFNIKIENFWDEYNTSAEDKKSEVIKSYIEMILRQILKFDEDEPIDENQNFSEMGMDSLMMLEMKNLMQTMLGKGVTMNVSAMQELTTVLKLVAHLEQLIANIGQEEERVAVDFDTFSDELIVLINQDMVLPDYLKNIKEGIAPALKRSQIKTILLTGVTGKFGPFMLRSILQRKEIEKVICIIRSKVRTSAKDRFKAAFEPLDILKEIDMSRVELVSGDISEKHFGLADTEWENLCNKVDAVFHCAVKANLMDSYTKFGKDGNISNKGTDIRTVNVIGSLNVMEMCVSGAQIKPLFFASTLLANQKTNVKEKTMWEDWYVGEEVFQLKNTGYPVSKFICEVLLKQFSDVGVPVGVFRFPALFGDSKSGRFILQNNHAAMRLLGFCKLGAIPAIPLPVQVLPSDLAADLSLNIFWNDEESLGVYNLTNPHASYFHDLPKISGEIGFPIEVVEWDDFSQKLNENEEYKTLFPQSEVDMEEGRYVDFSTSPAALQAWIQNPTGYFPSKKLLKIYPDLYSRIEFPLETIKRDLQFAIDSGICAKFGLKQSSNFQ